MFNRILDDQARAEYAPAIDELFVHAPVMMTRKLPRANVQQAFVYDTVKKFAKPDDHMLCVGAYEDTAYESLKNQGYSNITPLDPVGFGTATLEEFSKNTCQYAIVFSTSVLEHVADDEEHMRCMCKSIALGGYGVMTLDFQPGFKPGDRVPTTDFRFYTKEDLMNRLLPIIREYGCELVDAPQWDCDNVDFEWEGIPYTFATLVFTKEK